MRRIELPNRMIKLSCENGIQDTRTKRIYSEVVCKQEDEKYFVEVIY